MRLIGFVGKSGTGKSYKAIYLAKEQGVEYIIDDGLFIKGNKLIAGKSAKSEDSSVAAVKRALFLDRDHRETVKKAIGENNPDSIVIIGTSDKMIKKIVDALELGEIDEKVYIEEVSTKEDLEKAKSDRDTQGKHVIPLPTFEVKKDFSGHFKDTLKVIRERGKSTEVYEKTVVRPNFSYLGRYSISDKVIRKLIKHGASRVNGVEKVYRVYNKKYKQGIVISLDIFVRAGLNIPTIGREIQNNLVREMEYMTEINVLEVNVNVSRLIYA